MSATSGLNIPGLWIVLRPDDVLYADATGASITLAMFGTNLYGAPE